MISFIEFTLLYFLAAVGTAFLFTLGFNGIFNRKRARARKIFIAVDAENNDQIEYIAKFLVKTLSEIDTKDCKIIFLANNSEQKAICETLEAETCLVSCGTGEDICKSTQKIFTGEFDKV